MTAPGFASGSCTFACAFACRHLSEYEGERGSSPLHQYSKMGSNTTGRSGTVFAHPRPRLDDLAASQVCFRAAVGSGADMNPTEQAERPTLESIAEGALHCVLLVAGASKLCADPCSMILLAALTAEALSLPEVLQSSDPALLADHLALLFPLNEGDLCLGCALHSQLLHTFMTVTPSPHKFHFTSGHAPQAYISRTAFFNPGCQ